MNGVKTRFQPGHPYGQGDKPRGATRFAKHVKALEILDDLNFNPLIEAVKRYRDPKTPSASKDFCLGLITDRCFPKLKAIEITGDKAAAQVLINVIGAHAQQLAQPLDRERIDAPPIDDDPLQLMDACLSDESDELP